MNNKEILTKAIEKAVENGLTWYTKTSTEDIIDLYVNIHDDLLRGRYREIIFSHDFAKAFWGEKDYEYTEELTAEEWAGGNGNHYGAYFVGLEWQYHLQQMVLEEEPLKYIERFI